MVGRCTWVGCSETAVEELRGRDKKVWGRLCHKHNDQVNEHIRNGDAKGILGDWVRAHGGADKLAKEMAPDLTERLARKLRCNSTFRRTN